MKRRGLVASCLGFLALCLVLQAQKKVDWNRIDILCLVRDAQGRPVTNVTKDHWQILDAGESRAILEFSRPTDRPQIETVSNSPNLYQDAYQAIWRKLGDSTKRKILVIDDRTPLGTATPLTVERHWELIFLSERRSVVIYVLGNRAHLAGTPLADMAEQTGGRVAASELEIQADLDAQYHIVAQPAEHGPKVGLFHTLEVRVSTKGLRVQAPHSYYITPPWPD